MRPQADLLEDRVTPTGSITVTNAYLVNGSNLPISNIGAGEDISVHAGFTTVNLPGNASYRGARDVNGLTLDSPTIAYGAGTSGSGSWYYYLGNFIASPRTNQVTVTINPQASCSANTFSFTFTAASPPVSYLSDTVSQIRSAYGINSIPDFGSSPADGTGQTIAIVDAYNDPNILTDLDGFDEAMQLTSSSTESLYQQYGPASSILSVYNQSGINITSPIAESGQGTVPPVDPTGGWETEETLDVEWAHAIAPGAKIDLVECDGGSNLDGLFTGAATAAALPGVTVVSMSWIWCESNWASSDGAGELAYDSRTFVTPGGHPGVTILASSGDGGNPGGYPAFSLNVIAVGGTQLRIDGDSYGGETAWSYPTPRTLDNGSPSYSQSGQWTLQSGGFSGTYSTASGGSNSSANWTTTLTLKPHSEQGGQRLHAPGKELGTGERHDQRFRRDDCRGVATGDHCAAAGAAFGLTVSAEDSFGNVATSFDGQITIAVASGPGNLNGTVVLSATGGVAVFTDLISTTSGTIAVNASTSIGQQILHSMPTGPIIVSPAAPSQLVIETEPSSIDTAGQAFTVQPVVKEEDRYGNIVTTDSASTVTVARGSVGTSTLQGANLTETLVSGVATFDGLYYDKAESSDLSFTSSTPGVGAATSATITVNPAPASQLVLAQQPSATAIAGQPLAVQPVLDEEDQFGNIETGDNSTIVTVSLASGTGPLEGFATAKLSDGVATFADLAGDIAGAIDLDFSAGGLSVGPSTTTTINLSTRTRAVAR